MKCIFLTFWNVWNFLEQLQTISTLSIQYNYSIYLLKYRIEAEIGDKVAFTQNPSELYRLENNYRNKTTMGEKQNVRSMPSITYIIAAASLQASKGS